MNLKALLQVMMMHGMAHETPPEVYELTRVPETSLRAPKIKGKIVKVRTEPKIGRNEPCPCASGKKYKKCCI